MRVATRPSPEIDIGPVDLDCAFCVCDFSQPDLPIVYCSEGFEKLTGYTEDEIRGKNCRFLQFPTGHVDVEQLRLDGETLFDVKAKISQCIETQHIILNYKKDGTPFQNMMTAIPIAWDTPGFRYYVGFQAELHGWS